MAREYEQPICQIVTFKTKYYDDIRGWSQALRTVGMNFVIMCGAPTSLEDVLQNRPPTNASCMALESLKTAMNEAEHAVYRGNVYRKVPGGELGFKLRTFTLFNHWHFQGSKKFLSM